ncbi:MAG TPA: hypothetical protein VLI69_06530 [Gammaproteobacteria bacterium]|nr:hypothetical protein [Gammaproteobacteria bacterium]
MNKLWNILIAPIQFALGLLFAFGAPLTFVYLIYIDAKTSHTFFQWLILIICDAFLSAIWPIYWIFRFFSHILK